MEDGRPAVDHQSLTRLHEASGKIGDRCSLFSHSAKPLGPIGLEGERPGYRTPVGAVYLPTLPHVLEVSSDRLA